MTKGKEKEKESLSLRTKESRRAGESRRANSPKAREKETRRAKELVIARREKEKARSHVSHVDVRGTMPEIAGRIRDKFDKLETMVANSSNNNSSNSHLNRLRLKVQQLVDGLVFPSSRTQNSGQSNQASSYRVARIQETGDDVKHDDLTFDMRNSSPCSSPTGSLCTIIAIHHYIGDSDDEMSYDGVVRTIFDANWDDSEYVYNILLVSGADASIFPSTLLGKGTPATGIVGRLHDAQGLEIPVQAAQDMEIRLKDVTGRTVMLRERVAVSDRVSQPIISFGHLLQEGWSIDGSQQSLTHAVGANIPVILQNKSLVVQGTIHVLREDPPQDRNHVRAIQAALVPSLLRGKVGWDLDDAGCGVGRHFAERFQDPTLVKPGLSGNLCRTTLAEGNDSKWYVLELCERLDGLVQYDAMFHLQS